MQLSAKAYAKINLYLDVVGKRADGYHFLDMIMQSVDIFDFITIKENSSSEINVKCKNFDVKPEDNIVYKACKAFLDKNNSNTGFDILIEKNIPVAAGTAGGSADAAATLKLLNTLTNTNLNEQELGEIGLSLGADVPFCLTGGTAYVSGIGEEIRRLNTPKMSYVLLKNRDKLSTGEMYKILDSQKIINDKELSKLIKGIENVDFELICNNIFNAFEFCWDFDEMSKQFKKYMPNKVFLSGSGPTVCALFNDEASALNCANDLNFLNAKFTQSKNCGVEIV